MSKTQLLISALFLALLLVACAPKSAPAPPPQVPAPAAPAPAAAAPQSPIAATAPAKPAWEVEWDKTAVAAKQEGVVTWVTAAGAEPRARLSMGFKDKYGLKAESVGGLPGQIIPKILAERRVGLYLWDIMMLGASGQSTLFEPTGGSVPLGPALILPDLTDPGVIEKVWYGGKLPWIDRARHMLAPLTRPTASPVINTNLVKPGELKTWEDLLDPKWKGKILLLNPTLAGTPVIASLIPMLFEVKGDDWVRKLAAQEPVIVGDDRLGTEWVAHGKYPIYLYPAANTFTEFFRAGAPIMIAHTEDIEALTTLASAVSLIDKAPHPNAAKLFINWYLSKDGQTIFSKAYGAQSVRLDVPTDFLRPDDLVKPGQKYFQSHKEEVFAKIPDYLKKSKEIFGHLVK